MKGNIIIAGAGHAGLVAGAILAQNGFTVTVYEKKQEDELGHDWEDRFTFSLLTDILGISEDELDGGIWRYRGDCAFLSPKQKTKVIIHYDGENRQKVMWRKPLIRLLLNNAKKHGVKFAFGTDIVAPIVENGRVTGIRTAQGDKNGDLVIDCAGIFSPVRTNLPDSFGIEKTPRKGDIFYAYRAYFNKLNSYCESIAPFEVYLYHEGEQGLSWHCTNKTTVDVLIGRIEKLNDRKVEEMLEIFRKKRPWTGDKIEHGGDYGVIPVRRPLTKMVANGYAAAGDSAFMTTPMNGMGIDLSLLAGRLLAETLIKAKDFSAQSLWAYNRDFHRLYGGDAAKNEGLKNSLLSMPSEGVDFLFDNAVIQSSDLAGAGKNTKLSSLLGKFIRGMKQPEYFFTIIKGLIKGSKASRLYKKAPENYNERQIAAWSKKIEALDIAL